MLTDTGFATAVVPRDVLTACTAFSCTPNNFTSAARSRFRKCCASPAIVRCSKNSVLLTLPMPLVVVASPDTSDAYDGVTVATLAMAVRTAVAPEVVRFRPTARTQDVARSADISVRFSTSMDRASTKKAFKVLVDGKAIKGKISWDDFYVLPKGWHK